MTTTGPRPPQSEARPEAGRPSGFPEGSRADQEVDVNRRAFVKLLGIGAVGLLAGKQAIDMGRGAYEAVFNPDDGHENLLPESVRVYGFGDEVNRADGTTHRLGTPTSMADQWHYDVVGPENYENSDVHRLKGLINELSERDPQGQNIGVRYEIGITDDGTFMLEAVNGNNAGDTIIGDGAAYEIVG